MKRRRDVTRLSKRKAKARIRYTASAQDKVANIEAERYLERWLMPMIRYAREHNIDLKARFEERRKKQ